MSVQTFSAAAVPKPGMSMMGMTCPGVKYGLVGVENV